MYVIFVVCAVTVCLMLLALVIREFIRVWKDIVRCAAEEKIEELQERHRREMYFKNQEIKYLEYYCAHPIVDVQVMEFEEADPQ